MLWKKRTGYCNDQDPPIINGPKNTTARTMIKISGALAIQICGIDIKATCSEEDVTHPEMFNKLVNCAAAD
jgi:hypothetical protein